MTYAPWHIPLLIPISSNKNIFISVNSSNFTLACLKTTYHTNSGTEKILLDLGHFISRQIFQKLLNTSANNNVSL